MGRVKVEKLSDEDLKARGVFEWPVWTKEVSRFDWSYDSKEECYFLEGDVVVETDEGPVRVGKGDFVTFPKGMSCVWDVKESVRKHYTFPME